VASNNSSSSSSPSTSNKDVSSPSSLASDSTEFTNNVSSHSIVITPYKQPQQRHLQKHIDITQEEADGIVSPFPSPTATTPTAAAGLVVSTRKKQMSNYNDNNDYNNSKDAGKMTGKESQSKQQQKKQSTTSKRVKINNEQSSNQTTTWTKRKNNLVFSHMPITKQQQQQQQQSLSLRKQQHQQQLSQPQHSNNYNASKLPPILLSPNKPPTHPSSSTMKPSSQIFQTHSYMSDADMSTDLSEATPITTPAKSSWFRNYSDEDENDDDDQGEDGERKEGNYWVGGSANMDNEEEKDNDDSSSTKEDNVDGAINHIGKTSQSSNDLVGLEIFDTSETTLDNNNQPSLNWDISASIADLSFVSKRQYSNENSFFHGIYESGLDSASFEQVDTSAEERMCMDAEIELVYNVSGVDLPSFFMDRSSGDNSTDNSSVGNASVVGDDLDECASVEERRKVVRRIQQWRRGRARESRESRGSDSSASDAVAATQSDCNAVTIDGNASGGSGGTEEEDHENGFNDDDDDDDAIEMAPLTPGKSHNSSYDLNVYRDPDGYKESKLNSIDNLVLRMTSPTNFLGNLLWSLQPHRDKYFSNRRSNKSHYDDVDFDQNTDKCYRCISRWKKLMLVSIMLLLFGSLLSGDGLEKHHTVENYNAYGENDPLAKSNFVKRGHLPDDTDDYDGLLPYHPSDETTHLRNGADTFFQNYQQSAQPGVVMDDVWFHFEMEDDEFNKPLVGVLEWPDDYDDAGPDVNYHVKAVQYNSLVGIDSIVVLGDHQFGLEWLVDKLKRLYPDLNIQRGFNEDIGHNGRGLRGKISRPQRITKVIDPISSKVIHHLGGADGNDMKALTTYSKHILVVALFVNPYDWVALMQANKRTDKKSWRDYLSTVWETHTNILEYRASVINSMVIDSMEREDVKVVITVKYEKLLESFSNFDNFVSRLGMKAPELPGIVGLVDDIQSRTGLRADEDAGWKEPRDQNSFWADPIGCNVHLCDPSIQKMRQDTEYISYLNQHIDWKAENLIGYQQMIAPKPSVEQIVVLGERHSGAEWLVDRLSRCFPDIKVKYGFTRPGKFFQTEPTDTQPNTLVVSVFVNPFEWVEMMRRNPINAPAHKNLEWTEFVTSPWERERSSQDENLEDTASAECSFGFSYSEIIPCITQRDPNTDSFPLYELRPDGTAYSNLLKLREDKIKNFFSAANFDGVVDHIPIRYEDLVWNEDYTDDSIYLSLPFPGIAGLLEKIRDQTNLIADANAGWIVDEDGIFRAEPMGTEVTTLDPYFVQWMEDNVDWDVEELVGYFP
jgi:hypothetical protein